MKQKQLIENRYVNLKKKNWRLIRIVWATNESHMKSDVYWKAF